MNIKKTKFKGLLVVKQKNNRDNRGNLRETFNKGQLQLFSVCIFNFNLLFKIILL